LTGFIAVFVAESFAVPDKTLPHRVIGPPAFRGTQ